ncbi:hypothetical protein GJ631_17310 [Natronomonas sp. CBA1123]|uniref:DUF7546 family protein n=1 Tax=Natronomonas sp. CBA1123 TaxID=2668070 RepID=UPI0012EA4D6C|nr:hypothetical protein [Natronomonas sp. CBA1123]MUV88262.1 hypothetical protein [Natronomonas sp. CBA1123]
MFDAATRRFRALDDAGQRTLVYTVATANSLVLLSLLYAYFTDSAPTTYWAFPIIWLTAAAWAVLRTDPAPAERRTKLLAGAIAGGYFLVLGFVGGLFGPATGPVTGLTVQFTQLPPGWNPAILYGGGTVQFAIVPFTAIGYAVLSYLVYATAIEAESAVAGGVLGLFSCVSCTLPVVASVLSGIVGGGAALAAAASAQTYALGTVVYVITVGLLVYRPGLVWLRRRL